jgi:hypothetical protein
VQITIPSQGIRVQRRPSPTAGDGAGDYRNTPARVNTPTAFAQGNRPKRKAVAIGKTSVFVVSFSTA